jgi:hypothetical protein
VPTNLDRVIFGAQKNIDFNKFNMGSLVKAVTFDLEEFGQKGVQGVKILEGDITRLVTYEKAAKRAQEPYIQAGTAQGNLVLVVRDKKNSSFEAIAFVVKGYKDLRDKLAKSSAAVTNLDKGDKVIDGAAARQAEKFGTKVQDKDDPDYGEITGNIILCAHGRPAAVPSGRVIGDQFGKKTPEEIVKLIAGDHDPKKRIPKDYNGVVTLSGCFTASGGPEGSKQDDPFAAKVLGLLRGKGYSKVSVVGMPGPSITAEAGAKDSSGKTMKTGDKYVQANIPTTKEYAEKKKLEAEVEKARKPYQDAINAYNALVDPYNQANDAKKAATPDKLVAANAAFAKAKADLDKEQAAMNIAKAAYDKAVKDLEDSGLAKTVAHLKGTFGLRTVN